MEDWDLSRFLTRHENQGFGCNFNKGTDFDFDDESGFKEEEELDENEIDSELYPEEFDEDSTSEYKKEIYHKRKGIRKLFHGLQECEEDEGVNDCIIAARCAAFEERLKGKQNLSNGFINEYTISDI